MLNILCATCVGRAMDKSYVKLISHKQLAAKDLAVVTAVESLQRHSRLSAICSHCDNSEERRFHVTDVDDAGSIAEVKCTSCKETSYVCHSVCYCRRHPPSNRLECLYKEKLTEETENNKQLRRKSPSDLHVCSVMQSVVTLLRRHASPNSNTICSCGNADPQDISVTDVDRLGFITGVQCSKCHQQLAFSPLEESYVAQMINCEQSDDQQVVIEKALSGEHDQRLRELCDLLRRHSFYADSICTEFDSADQESCRVMAINKDSGNVTEVEFVTPTYNQRLQITCYSGCYYDQHSSPCQYELTYKKEMRNHLRAINAERESATRDQRSEMRSNVAILSCTVLTANAAVVRRHNIDNKLCQNCMNDDCRFLEVINTDRYGFIVDVKCTKCKQTVSTACHHTRFYYEEIDESKTLQRGDHISWHRNLAYWHHAIVTHTNGRKITVAHYGRDGRSVTFHESMKNRKDMAASCLHGTPYRITYDDCYTAEYAALRAEKRLSEKHYNVLNRNCEHYSHWCKTGLSKSDQIVTCFSFVAKSILTFGLRVFNMVLLIVFQVIHESRERMRNETDRKAFERFEHIITSTYILLVFLLFLVYSMYTKCKRLKPTSANRSCCYRPFGAACGLTVRVVVRELFAASGPFLLIWFEDRLLSKGPLRESHVTVIFMLLAVTVVSLAFGAVIGTLLEYVFKRCISFCRVKSSTHVSEHSQGETPSVEDPEIRELPQSRPPVSSTS